MHCEASNWLVQPCIGIASARAALCQDPIANVYALGDLEPPYDRYTTVAVAERDGIVEAACLVVRHPAFTGIVTHGAVDGLRAILATIELPDPTHLDLPDDHRSTVERFYTFTEPHHRRLTAVDTHSFRPPTEHTPGLERLGPDDLDDLIDLYTAYDASGFHPAQLEHGVFYGVREGGRLVAAGSTPGLALRSGVAIVTSVYTRPEARRRGFGAAVTSAITAELFSLGCRDVCLDVETTNAEAIRVYERFGYRLHSHRCMVTPLYAGVSESR
jgi:GNAT superfamily N-acetyltransferase